MERNKKYKVTNKAKDVRKFRDQFFGKDIFVGPNKSVYTDHPPDNTDDIWKVKPNKVSEKSEELEEPKEAEEIEENKLNNTGG